MLNYLLLVMSCLAISFNACSNSTASPTKTNHQEEIKAMQKEGLENIVLGAGCFWCVEAIFQELQGVESVVSGYSNGMVVGPPTYKEVCTGLTGYAEVAQITYDPKVITLDEILEVFWTTHDPTTLNRQGNDVGTQYRSGIYYQNEAQKAAATASKANFAPTLWDDPITTEIAELDKFYPAEDYHQNYFDLNPNQPYCMAVVNPKVQKFRKAFKDKLKK